MSRVSRARRLPTVLIAIALFAACLMVATAASPASSAVPDGVRLNQMQVIGTHNSYHIEPTAKQIETMMQFRPDAYQLQYTHPPLAEQFQNEGVRQLELDVFADPTGDLWRPKGRPGFKVFHIEQVDMGSRCEVFVDCLQQVKAWSDAHSAHMPIAILLEVKDDADIPVPPDPVPMTPELLHDLDDEIRSVFPPSRLITPDDVRGDHATLEEAVLTDGWPRIDDVRGRVMFLLDNRRDQYVDGDPTLAGRVAFPPSTPGQPDAAFIKENDPLADFDRIQDEVAKGYIVRSRADSPVDTAKSGDTSQRDAAFASGAHWVSTDYPVPGLSERWGTDYVAQIPGGTPARCNPITGPPECTSLLIENPAQVNPAPTTTTTAAPASTSTTVVTGPVTFTPVAAPVSATPAFTG